MTRAWRRLAAWLDAYADRYTACEAGDNLGGY